MAELISASTVSGSLIETNQLGEIIASALQPGLLVTLKGTLGAGKTFLVQAIAETLGLDRKSVVSPTFTLIQVHRGRLELVHIDAYRIADDDQYFELGIDEYIDSDGVVAMEWAEKFDALLPDDRLQIEIDVLDEHQRRYTIRWPASDCLANQVGSVLKDALG